MSDTVFDQDTPAVEVLDVDDATRVYRDDPIGWAYLCYSDRCALNASGKQWHCLSGYPTRALAVDAAVRHVEAVRARRAVIA